MDSKMFLACIKRADFQTVFVTFNKDGLSALQRIYGLSKHKPGPMIEQSYQFLVETVLSTRNWERDVNRTISMCLLDRIDENTLITIARDVEKIECGRHAASAINTTRIKTKTDGAKAIIDGVLNETILSEVSSWGVNVEGELVEYEGLPAIEFRITNSDSGELFAKVFVDGWSGRMGRNGEWGDRRYTDPQQLREMIYSALTDALDAVTA